MIVWSYVVGGVAIGAAVGIYEYIKNKSKSDRSDFWQALLKDQLVCDRISATEVKGWFDQEKIKCNNHAVGLIIRPQEKIIESLGPMTEENKIDPEHYLIFLMYNNDSNECNFDHINPDHIISMKLVNYKSTTDSFKSKIDAEGIVMVSL